MRLTADVVLSAPSRISPSEDRELNLRGTAPYRGSSLFIFLFYLSLLLFRSWGAHDRECGINWGYVRCN